MQHLKEFLIRIQTFNLRVIDDDIQLESGTNEKKHVKAYDLTYETQYYDSFSYRSELRILKDMAFIDLMTLDKDHILLQLAELSKVRKRFKEFWGNYHQHYSEMNLVYHRSFIITVRLEYLFIVNNLQSDSSDIEVTAKFAEDLGDSVKLREKFLMELIHDTENSIKEKRENFDLEKLIQAKLQSKEQIETAELELSAATITPEELPISSKVISRYPTFKEGVALQLLDLFNGYFIPEDYPKLEKLLLADIVPERPLVFRGFANQLADAFKQLYDANLIVGCLMVDLEKWIAPKFVYLANQPEPKELTEGYLNSLMSTKTRPCKSPILKIELKEDKFLILPAARNKR